MDWEKLKRIFIYLLLLLNVILLSANFAMNREYVLSSSREKAIYKVLGDNGIGLYTELIKKTPPMRDLSVSMTSLDPNYYRTIFFEQEEEVKITPEYEKIILKSKDKELILDDNNIRFINPQGTGEISEFNKENALKASDEFLKSIDTVSKSGANLEDITFKDDSYVFEYNERFNGYKLFSNTKTVVVSKNGITSLCASYYTAENFVGEKKEIASCDEALLTLLGAVKKDGIENGTYIDKIELGYDFQSLDEVADGSSIRLIPYYRIFLGSNEKTYVINAYTNEIK